MTQQKKKSKPGDNAKQEDKSGEVDYGATADAFASDSEDGGDVGSKGQVELVDVEHSEDESDVVSDSDGSQDSESDVAESLEDEKNHVSTTDFIPPPSLNGEQCSFDLRNLMAINSHQISTSELYSEKKKQDVEEITLSGENMELKINEEYLLDKAADGCAQLIGALWQLPIERSDAGPLAFLPSFDDSKIPRALPPPPPKKETRWEKFAKERGISVNKEKRSRKVWDEATGTWMFRHGYQKANDDTKEWPIMEVKGNQDPFENPWDRLREEKRNRTERNMENRMRNKERGGELTKGTTNRVLKSREKNRQAGKAGGNSDRDTVPPTGVPVDLADKSTGGKLRGKASLNAALLATQRSTASLGRFDKMREGEPDRKKAVAGLKKRKYESATDKKVIASETDRSMKLLKSVVDGGGVAKEKARRKGQLAKGETAYDYEFDDGLGASSFRKKKGRAGAGKMKKMTKKRVK
jgi:regulator of ribosome biosynthesis